MDLSLSQMVALDAVARNHSFSRAAAELHVGQPVVSRTVALAERILSVTLFTRTTRAVELTEVGEAYLLIARGVLAAADRAHKQWAGYLAGENGTVTVAALPSVAAVVLPAAVTAFTRDHPGRSVVVFDVPADEGVSMLRAGDADLAICDAERASQVSDSADISVLSTDDLVAVAAPDSRVAGLSEVTWATLSQEPFVALQPGSSVRALTDFGFASAGATPRAVTSARGLAPVAGLVAANIGVSAMPVAVLPLLGFRPLAIRPLTQPIVTRTICLVSRRTLPPAAGAFHAALIDAFGQGAHHDHPRQA